MPRGGVDAALRDYADRRESVREAFVAAAGRAATSASAVDSSSSVAESGAPVQAAGSVARSSRTARRPVGPPALFGATLGVLVLGMVLLPRFTPLSVYMFSLLCLAGAALLESSRREIARRDYLAIPSIEEFAPDVSSGSEIGLLNLMRAAGLTESNSEGRRMIEQNAVSIDGEKVEDTGLYIDVAQQAPFVLQVGKRRYVKVVTNGSA